MKRGNEMYWITLLKSAMRSIDTVRLIGNRLGATPFRHLRRCGLSKLQWSFETSRYRSTLVRRVQLGIRNRRSQLGRRTPRGPNLVCHRLSLQPELLRWDQVLARLPALVVGRLPAKGSLLSRPCLIRGHMLLQRSRACGPVGVLVHFEPAAPARHLVSGSLPQQRPTERTPRSGDFCGYAVLVPDSLTHSGGLISPFFQTIQLVPDSTADRTFTFVALWPSAELQPHVVTLRALST